MMEWGSNFYNGRRPVPSKPHGSTVALSLLESSSIADDDFNNPAPSPRAKSGNFYRPVKIGYHRRQPNNRAMITIMRFLISAVVVQLFALLAYWFVIEHSSLK